MLLGPFFQQTVFRFQKLIGYPIKISITLTVMITINRRPWDLKAIHKLYKLLNRNF